MNLRCKKGQLAMITDSKYNNGMIVQCLELRVVNDTSFIHYGFPAWRIDKQICTFYLDGKFSGMTDEIEDFKLTPINDPDLDICTEETEEIQKENRHV